jgi:hypothetical protein
VLTIIQDCDAMPRERGQRHGLGGGVIMAVRTILATLNGLTHAGRSAGWLRRAAGTGTRTSRSARTRSATAEWGEGPYARGGVEPPLEEVLGDPVVQCVMRADRCEPAEIRRLLKSKQPPAV